VQREDDGAEVRVWDGMLVAGFGNKTGGSRRVRRRQQRGEEEVEEAGRRRQRVSRKRQGLSKNTYSRWKRRSEGGDVED
jgi:hypothetical protein